MGLDAVEPETLTCLTGIEFGGRDVSTIEPAECAADRDVIRWLRAIDRSFVTESCDAPPVWLFHQFKWGPHAWPVRWRDIPEMPYTDCGFMAALSVEIYRWRKAPVFPCQLVLSFTEESTSGWARLWGAAGLGAHWCSGTFAYHEGCALIGPDGEARIWDPLGRFWLPVSSCVHYEGVIAFRICGKEDLRPLVKVNGRRVGTGVWYWRSEVSKSYEGLSWRRRNRSKNTADRLRAFNHA